MFRIKICGITRAEDARAAVEAGADAIGLNFYEKSPRYLEPTEIDERWSAIDARTVGVFVNAIPEEILEIVNYNEISAVQLHGDESPELLQQLSGKPVIRARRMDDRGIPAIAEDIEACRAAGRAPDAVLVDAYSKGQYGGTGETVSWAGLADYRKWLGDMPLILAGGLTPENVAEAIRTVQPHGVDVASGVELSPGVKCPDKMRLFISNAKSAFDSIA